VLYLKRKARRELFLMGASDTENSGTGELRVWEFPLLLHVEG
jgi:hypothetical protein